MTGTEFCNRCKETPVSNNNLCEQCFDEVEEKIKAGCSYAVLVSVAVGAGVVGWLIFG